ncbi:hypothetical protein KQI84_00545 [bacterium]|nr:hypothetical protein [bacterium]
MKRIKKRIGAYVLSTVLGAGLFSAVGAQPARLRVPDVELPAAATAPDVEARSVEMQAVVEDESPQKSTSRIVLQIKEIQKSTLPIVAKERLLFEAAQFLGDAGTTDAVPTLRELSRQPAEATFTIPDEREPVTLAYYDFPRAAAIAADNIEYRDAKAQFVARLSQDAPAAVLQAALDQDEPARVRGALDALEDSDVAWQKLIDSPELAAGKSRPVLGALIVSAERQNRGDVLVQLARTLDTSHAQLAMLAYGRVREVVGVGAEDTLRMIDERPQVLGAVALGTLHANDATPEVQGRLKEYLGDADLGADAVAALQRMDDSVARQIAFDVLADSAGGVAERRAVLLLMRDNTESAREALSEYANRPAEAAADAALKKKVTQWLAN